MTIRVLDIYHSIGMLNRLTLVLIYAFVDTTDHATIVLGNIILLVLMFGWATQA